MRLKTKIWLALSVVMGVVLIVDQAISFRMLTQAQGEELESRVREVRAVLMSLRRVYQQEFIDSGLPVNDDTLGLLPAHAISRISSDFPNWSRSGILFNNVSDIPRNPGNRADRFELDAIDWFRNHPKEEERLQKISDDQGSRYFHYTAPIWIEPYCLECHGDRDEAPESIQTTYDSAFGYQEGDLRGVMSIKIPMAIYEHRFNTQWQGILLRNLASYFILFLVLGFIVDRLVTRRLTALQQNAQQLATGDYSARSQTRGKDEVAELAQSFNHMAGEIQERNHSLLQERDKNQNILATVSSIIVSLDKQGMISFINRAGCEILGKTEAELVGKNWFEIALPQPDGIKKLYPVFQQMIRDRLELPNRFENLIVDRNGSERLFAWNNNCLRDENNQIIGTLSSGQDITEQKQSELALAESQQQLIKAEAQAHMGHWWLDGSSGEAFWAKEIFSILGLPSDGPAGPGILHDRVHPDDWPAVEASLNTALDGGHEHDMEYRIIRPDGETRYLHCRALRHIHPETKSYRLEGTVQDISDRKRQEERLRQTAVVFDNTHDGIVVTDANERILMVNRAFSYLTGYSEEEVIGKTPRILGSGRHNREFYTTLWNNLQHQGHWHGEIWNRRKNGELYPELLSINAVKDDAGEIHNYIGIFTDISQLKDVQEKLEFMVYHDPVTGLPNRRLLQDRLQHSINIAEREGRRLALLTMDLDRFKDINDSYGHPAGDELLRQVAQRLTNNLPSVDTITRLGGDEFALLLENIQHQQDAARLANQVLAILQHPWHLPNGAEVRISATIGISLYPDHGTSAEMLLQQSDAALYRAKREGQDKFRYFSEDLTASARSRIELETRLRKAIDRQELRVYYQPQIDIRSGRIIGAEALVRWQDPENGLIPPIQFIPVAEEIGLIRELGLWVLQETCRQGQQWREEGLIPLRLAVNISPHQLGYEALTQDVMRVLSNTGYPAEYLELELTESALMAREDEAVVILESLRGLGVSLALDDFGTGYSSLAYLKRFPLNVLKIDKSFVDDIPNDRDDMEIAASIITLGHTLGYKVLAEGVETNEQLAFLQFKGCDLYQGYMMSPPLPADEFAALIMKQ